MKSLVGWGRAVTFALAVVSGTPSEGSAETLGFVVSHWRGPIAEQKGGRCPGGFNVSEAEHFGVDLVRFRADLREHGWEEATRRHFPEDACRDPAAQPDPGFSTLAGNAKVTGLDLDGAHSRAAEEGTCGHEDFTAPDGTSGIDNQHLRLVGCTHGYRTTGVADLKASQDRPYVLGAFPILVEVADVDDRRNDDAVRVRISSSAERVKLDANRAVVGWSSLDAHPDPAYTGPFVAGRIRDGILESDPADLRLRFEQQGVIDHELRFRGARIRASLSEAGLDGVLGFYWDIENFYRIHNDHSVDGKHTGRVAALARFYMCAGMYHALARLADGHPDPETGRCTSISSASRFRATPAFVIRGGRVR